MSAQPAADFAPDLLRVDQVIAKLQVGRSHLYRLIRNGQLRVIHVGRVARIPRSEVEAFISRLQDEQWGDEAS